MDLRDPASRGEADFLVARRVAYRFGLMLGYSFIVGCVGAVAWLVLVLVL